jgi:hypothetical protein
MYKTNDCLEMNIDFFQVPNEIFDKPNGLTSIQKLVYIYLCRKGNQGSVPFPSYQTIADGCGIGRRTAIEAVKILVERDWLGKTTRVEPGSGFTSNTYKIKNPTGVTQPPLVQQPHHPSAVAAPPSAAAALKEEPGSNNPLKIDDIDIASESEDLDIKAVSGFLKNSSIPAYYEKAMGSITGQATEMLFDLVNRYGEESVRHAIRKTALRGGVTVFYVKTLLEEWEKHHGEETPESEYAGTERSKNDIGPLTDTDGRPLYQSRYGRRRENTDPDKYHKGKYGRIVRR